MQAVSFMIASQLVTKNKLNHTFCIELIVNALKSSNRFIQEKLNFLLLTSQTQDNFSITEEILEKILRCSWLFTTLNALYEIGLDIVPFLIPLFRAIFEQFKSDGEWSALLQKNCDLFLANVYINGRDARLIIRFVLENYIENFTKFGYLFKGLAQYDKKCLKKIECFNPKTTKWHEHFIKCLATRLPVEFDSVVKDMTQNSIRCPEALKYMLGK